MVERNVERGERERAGDKQIGREKGETDWEKGELRGERERERG